MPLISVRKNSSKIIFRFSSESALGGLSPKKTLLFFVALLDFGLQSVKQFRDLSHYFQYLVNIFLGS